MIEQQCQAGPLPKVPLRYRIRNYIKERLMALFRRYAYRHVSRFLHRFNLHYAPYRPFPLEGDKPGERHHWCQWCGLRGTTYVSDPKDEL